MLHDLRYAFRSLRRAPGFTGSAVLALALGIGANTAVFSVVYAALLKPLPYPHPEQLVRLYEANPKDGIERSDVSIGTFADWRSRSRAIAGAAMYSVPLGGETLWTVGDRAIVVRIASVSPSVFALLGVQPILGHPFRAEGDDAPAGAPGQFLISYGLWQRVFGGAADVVGRPVMIEGRLPREIIGVLPPDFSFPAGTEAWTSAAVTSVPANARRSRAAPVIARLAPGASLDDARRDLKDISGQLAHDYPVANAGWTAQLEPLGVAEAHRTRFALLALMAAVAGVMLIGCANLANLLLARAAARRREIAVRLSLGAGVRRLITLYLCEAGFLALAGLAAGLLLGHWLTGILVRLAPPDVPRLSDVRLSAPVFLFAAVVSAAAAIATSLAPAWQTIHAGRQGTLRPETRSVTQTSAWLRRWLVAGEVAVVTLLLTGALLFLRTFVNLRGVDLGFESHQVIEMETRWPIGTLFGRPGQQWPRVQRAVDGLLAAVSGVPGVDAAGLISDVPLTDAGTETDAWRADAPGAHGLEPPADPHDRAKSAVAVVSPGYFPALRIPMLRGRNFTDADRFSDAQLVDRTLPRRAVAVVNAAFAARFFNGGDPVGHAIVLGEASAFAEQRTIVGVVADVRANAVGEAAVPTAYFPHAQNPDVFRPSLLIRTSLPMGATIDAVRQRLAAYDPKLVVLRVRPMNDVVSGALSRPRFNLLLLSAFALVALILAAVGIYGVLAYLVTQRTREIGIRMALGARGEDVLRLLLREGMTPVLVGAAAGVAGSLLAARALRSLLFGVTPLDPASLAGSPALLVLVALLACYLPARRGRRVDPMIALRDD